MTCFLFDVKFWQMDHVFAKFASAIFCLLCYYVCAETATFVILALILYSIKLSLPGFVHNLSFCRGSNEQTNKRLLSFGIL